MRSSTKNHLVLEISKGTVKMLTDIIVGILIFTAAWNIGYWTVLIIKAVIDRVR